jgi:hypothetical protein
MRHFVFLLRFPGLGYLVILTVHTAEIAVSKKNIPGAVGTAQARLLAEMRGVRRDDREPPRIACGDLVLEPVITAVLRADIACP